MAKANTKAEAPNVDLNGENMTDYGNNTPFIPFGEGKYVTRLLALAYHQGYKGNAYRAKVKILKSDRKDVNEGYDYAIQFKLAEDKTKREIQLKGLRSLCAAVYDADPADKDFDGNKALATLLELSTEDMLEGEDMQLEIVSREKQAVDKVTKIPVNNPDGTPKMFSNLFYNKLEKEAA